MNLYEKRSMPVGYFCAILCRFTDLNLGFPLPKHLIQTLPPRNLHISFRYISSSAPVLLVPHANAANDRVARVNEDVLFSDSNYLETIPIISRWFRQFRRTQFLSSVQISLPPVLLCHRKEDRHRSLSR